MHVVSKDFIFKKSVQVTVAKNEEIYGIVPFSCYVTKTLWVSGSNGSTGVTYFQPIMLSCGYVINVNTIIL